MAKPKTPTLLRSKAGLSLLSKVLNGETPSEDEMAVARQMAQQAVAQRTPASQAGEALPKDPATPPDSSFPHPADEPMPDADET